MGPMGERRRDHADRPHGHVLDDTIFSTMTSEWRGRDEQRPVLVSGDGLEGSLTR